MKYNENAGKYQEKVVGWVEEKMNKGHNIWKGKQHSAPSEISLTIPVNTIKLMFHPPTQDK